MKKKQPATRYWSMSQAGKKALGALFRKNVPGQALIPPGGDTLIKKKPGPQPRGGCVTH